MTGWIFQSGGMIQLWIPERQDTAHGAGVNIADFQLIVPIAGCIIFRVPISMQPGL